MTFTLDFVIVELYTSLTDIIQTCFTKRITQYNGEIYSCGAGLDYNGQSNKREVNCMAYYNLAAEYASLVILCVAMVSFMMDERKGTTRYSALKWMQLATFISIIISIGSLITADFYMNFPIWVVDLLKYLYFLTSPVAAPIALFYGITLIYHKTHKISLIKNYAWAWLPYLIYCLFVVTNPFHRLIFTISPTEGYVRGDFFRITYVIALLYFLLVILFTIKNFKRPQKNALLIICLNLLVASLIFCTQLIFPPVQLSGLASVVGVLIIQFYIQNVSHSTDSLTELYNRSTLTGQMTKLCNSNTPYTLFVFSIRNFKGINERNGLKFGDALLENIALKLRESHLHRRIFRYSGDEFAVFFPEFQNKNIEKIHSICKSFSEPFIVNDITISLDFVYVRVDFPEFGTKTEEIISAVDYSLSIIKKETSSQNFFFDNSVCHQMKRRNYIIERIKHALETDGFEAHYQPIFSSSENDFTMAEALIRFKSNQGEFISPAEFIPIAEDTGLIVKITMTMLELVCADYKKLIDLYGSLLKTHSISVNFPYIMFMKSGAVDDVYNIVTKHNLNPNMIKIELTERTFAKDIDATLVIMNEFISRGFVFELDDFGVEYSNFSMFFNVPIRIIKFDRSLVTSSTADDERRDFLKKFLVAIKALGKDIEVVMEGVEDDETKDFLISCDCDYIQGYVFSKPLPFKDYTNFIK